MELIHNQKTFFFYTSNSENLLSLTLDATKLLLVNSECLERLFITDCNGHPPNRSTACSHPVLTVLWTKWFHTFAWPKKPHAVLRPGGFEVFPAWLGYYGLAWPFFRRLRQEMFVEFPRKLS